jgi:hypothetical protein
VEATVAADILLEVGMRATVTPVVAATAVVAIGKHSLLFWM